MFLVKCNSNNNSRDTNPPTMGHEVSLENVQGYFIKAMFPKINTKIRVEINNKKVANLWDAVKQYLGGNLHY